MTEDYYYKCLENDISSLRDEVHSLSLKVEDMPYFLIKKIFTVFFIVIFLYMWLRIDSDQRNQANIPLKEQCLILDKKIDSQNSKK